MAKRSYHRLTDEQLITELQDKIKKVEGRIHAKTRTDAELLKQLPKLGRSLRTFAQLALKNEREDISNMTLAFLAGLQRAAEEVPEDTAPKFRSRGEKGKNDKG